MAKIDTTDIQIKNAKFINSVESGMVKQAQDATTGFVRQKLREASFSRKILAAETITPAELERKADQDEPYFLGEIEPDSVAAVIPFTSRPEIRYYKNNRYEMNFVKITSPTFKKNKMELLTSRVSIQDILQKNSIKDLQEEEDARFCENVRQIAIAAGNTQTIGGGFSITKLLDGAKMLAQHRLNTNTILMTQSMYLDLLKEPATQVGSGWATAATSGENLFTNAYGYNIMVTNKNNILPDSQVMLFAAPEYLGKMLILQDATVFMKTERDVLEFDVSETIGAAIANANGCAVLNF